MDQVGSLIECWVLGWVLPEYMRPALQWSVSTLRVVTSAVVSEWQRNYFIHSQSALTAVTMIWWSYKWFWEKLSTSQVSSNNVRLSQCSEKTQFCKYLIFCYNSCSVSEQTTSLESSSSRLSLSVSLSLVLIVSIVFSNCIRDKSKQWSHFISFTPLKHYIKHKTELFHRKEAHSKIFVWEIKSTKLTSKVTTEWDAEERDSI